MVRSQFYWLNVRSLLPILMMYHCTLAFSQFLSHNFWSSWRCRRSCSPLLFVTMRHCIWVPVATYTCIYMELWKMNIISQQRRHQKWSTNLKDQGSNQQENLVFSCLQMWPILISFTSCLVRFLDPLEKSTSSLIMSLYANPHLGSPP